MTAFQFLKLHNQDKSVNPSYSFLNPFVIYFFLVTFISYYFFLHKVFSSSFTVYPVLTPTFPELPSQLLVVLKCLAGTHGELRGLCFRWCSVVAELEKCFSLVFRLFTAARTPIDKRWPTVESKHQSAADSPRQKSGAPSKIYKQKRFWQEGKS